jgi:hypothetical protein
MIDMTRENPKTIVPLLLGSPDLLAELRISDRIFRDWAERDPALPRRKRSRWFPNCAPKL